MSENNNHPLILVFYLDRDMMNNPQIIQPFADSVNNILAQKDANAMAFFLPTDDNERIECINPKQVEPAEMDRINTIVNDLVKNFDMGPKNDEEDIEE
jgi:hypothetical protein